MDGDEDSFDAEMESENLLEEQRATPPLSSKPEGTAPAKDEDGAGKERQQAAEPDPELPEALKGKYVPHGRFHETNERLKETNQRYGLLEQRTNKLLEIIQQQMGNAPQQQAQAEEIPDPETDFVGALKWSMGQLKDGQKQTKEQQQRQQQEQQGVELGRRVLSATQQDFAAAQAEDPTLDDAYNHLTNSRVRELMAVRGFTKDEAEAHYKQEELDLYHGALQRQERPSAVVKRLAEARGWVPKAPTNDNANEDTREQRKLQHRSLSQMGGREGPSALNAKDLAKMSEDEYAKLSDDVIKSIMRKAS